MTAECEELKLSDCKLSDCKLSDLSVLCTVNRQAWQQPDRAIWTNK